MPILLQGTYLGNTLLHKKGIKIIICNHAAHQNHINLLNIYLSMSIPRTENATCFPFETSKINIL